MHSPEDIVGRSNLKSLEQDFQGRIGGRIVHLHQTTSTMDVAREMIAESDDASSLHGTAVIADSQSQGRGRFGRKWDSSGGNDILVSVIVCPRVAIAGRLTIMASLAAAITVDEITSTQSAIKWPNDVLVHGKKICGLIAESVTTGSDFAGIIGIGLNVNQLPSRDQSSTYSATSLRELSGNIQSIDRRAVLSALLENLNELYDALERGESIMPEWREKLVGLGSKVEVSFASDHRDGEVVSGVAEDVDEFGRLMIRDESGLVRAVSAGEVTTRASSGEA